MTAPTTPLTPRTLLAGALALNDAADDLVPTQRGHRAARARTEPAVSSGTSRSSTTSTWRRRRASSQARA